tara:strand:+ start:605 stop:1327 length:723 start_codon:yes stop_codon:yes gene_type:complete
MLTNLAAKVTASQLTRREISDRKGVTPNTLNRHMKGEINLNIEDALDYAKILGCTPQEIMFVSAPLDIIGHNFIDIDDSIHRTYYGSKTTKQAYIPDYYIENTAAFTWECHEEYEGFFYDWHNAIQIVLKEPVVHHYVDKRCIQQVSVVKFAEPQETLAGRESQISAGVLYPAPGNRYTIHAAKLRKIYENVKLIWATPQVQVIHRPDLRACEIVDSACEHTNDCGCDIISMNPSANKTG